MTHITLNRIIVCRSCHGGGLVSKAECVSGNPMDKLGSKWEEWDEPCPACLGSGRELSIHYHTTHEPYMSETTYEPYYSKKPRIRGNEPHIDYECLRRLELGKTTNPPMMTTDVKKPNSMGVVIADPVCEPTRVTVEQIKDAIDALKKE